MAAPMMTDNDVLARLDWQTLTCQCEIMHCSHRRKPCTSAAIRRVDFHALDHCTEPDLGRFGNYVFLLCVPCVVALAAGVEAHIGRINEFGRATCLTCGAPITKLDHIFREIAEL